MLVSFDDAIPDAELDQFLADIEGVVRASGLAQTITSQRHLPVPGEDEIPAMIATAVLQFGVADLGALAALFAAPGAGEVIGTWRARHPYKVAWVNHEALS